MSSKRRELDFTDLIKTLIHKMKIIIVIAIIGALLGGGGAFATGRTQVTTSAGSDGSLEEAKAKLDQGQIEKVQDAVKSYDDLRKKRKDLLALMDNSQYLNLDVNKADGVRNIYLISKKNQTSAILKAMISLTKNDELRQEINEKLDQNLTKYDFDHMIQIYDGETLKTANNREMTVVGEDNNDVTRLLVVDVYSSDENSEKIMVEAVKDRLNAVINQISASEGDYKANLIGRNTINLNADDVIDLKLDYTNQLNAIASTINQTTGYFNDEEKAYFNALVTEQTTTIAKNKNDSNAKVTTVFSKKQFLKYAILGFVGFGILAVLGLFMQYILDKSVHTVEEIKSVFRLDILCRIPVNKKGESNEQSIKVASEELQYLTEKYSGEKIGILTSSETIADNGILEKIISNDLRNKVVPLKARPETDNDFTKLSEIKRVVLVEGPKVSKYDDLEETLNYYFKKQIEIEGAIVLI